MNWYIRVLQTRGELTILTLAMGEIHVQKFLHKIDTA